MTDSVPEKLGKYKIIKEVGRGGFAAVYKAVDTTLNRAVAFKVLAPHLLWDPTFVQRFQREAEVAANLDHPHIVTIYEVGLIEGVYFIAMQFLEGRTLSQVLEAEGPLPVSRVQAIIEQMASALDYAHARGFVHRDIKPSNLIVADDGRATLTDFGLVKAGEGTKLSTTGVVFGTPEYMSPEQAEGKMLDARSDVYSLGVVLYEMLTSKVPFSGVPIAVMRGHADKPPPRPSEINPDISQAVETVLLRTLAKKQEKRYQSAGEMARALTAAVKAKARPRVERKKKPTVEMVPIPAGEFLMGTREEDVGKIVQEYDFRRTYIQRETPQREVFVQEFEMGKYPVTNAKFQWFVEATGYRTQAEQNGYGKIWSGSDWERIKEADWRHPQGPHSSIEERMDHPVVQVSWHDAVAYCEWLSEKTGEFYRLPTETEWEKAARGTDGRQFPWGDEWDESRCNTTKGGPGTTTPVGKYSPHCDSHYGVADMAGNVWEWCADWFQAYAGNSFSDEYYGEASKRVLRGGSWKDHRVGARCAYREGDPPDHMDDRIGFRCVKGSSLGDYGAGPSQLADIPSVCITPPPGPKRAVFLALLLIAIGWPISGAIGLVIGGAIGLVIGGAIGGLITGLALRQRESSILWKQVLIVTIGWAIGWAIDRTISEAIGWATWEAVGGTIGGLITGLALWQSEPSIPWKRVLIVTIGWVIGWAIGLATALAIGLVIGGDIGWVIGWVIGRAIGGAIGGGVMFWQLNQARRKT